MALFSRKVLPALAFVMLVGNAQNSDDGLDFGEVAPGSVQPLKLVAQNANCPAPQNFRIEHSNKSWLRMSGPTVLSNIPAGSSKSSELLLDFSNLKPGKYEGNVKINCESCGWWIFSTCSANDQEVEIQFRIPKPAARNPGKYDSFSDAMNDVAGGSVNIPLGPPVWLVQSQNSGGPAPWVLDNDFETPDQNNDQPRAYELEDSGKLAGPPKEGQGSFEVPAVGVAEYDIVIDGPKPPQTPPQTPGQDDFPIEIFEPDNQNPTFRLVDGGVIWIPHVIPHVGGPVEEFPYPPTPIGGNEGYPGGAKFGGFGWDDWRVGAGVRYTEDDADSPIPPAPGSGNGPPKVPGDFDNDGQQDAKIPIHPPGTDLDGKPILPDPNVTGTKPGSGDQGFGFDDNIKEPRVFEGPISGDGANNIDGLNEPGAKRKSKAIIFRLPGEYEKYMPGRDLKNLRDTRRRCIRKTAAVAAAQSDAADKTKKANNCLKKLAALKAALDKAKAEQAAADTAAKDAADHLANYDADLAAAQKASRMAVQTMQMQAAAHISLVREKDAGNPRPAAEAHAKAQVDKAVKAVEEASRAVSAVRNSKKARTAAARNAKKAAEAAAKKTKAAQKAYDKQKALCDPLVAAAKAAQKKVVDAEKALAECRAKLKDVEAAAPGQALKNLQQKLAQAQGRKQGCKREMDKYARQLGKAFKALRLLKVIRPPKEDPKTERILNDEQEFYFALLASGAAKAANVATFEVFAALDALKAGYGLYKIKNSSLIPSTSRFVRSELSSWLTETKGITDGPDDAEAVIKIMEGIVNRNGSTEHIRENWKRMEAQCKKNDEDIARLQKQIAEVAPK